MTQELLDSNVIQHGSSPFASSVMVEKKDHSWRMCMDYRSLNNLTIMDKFPIPIIEEFLDELGDPVVFSKLYLHLGYHQIQMEAIDIHKTEFRTHIGW